MVIKVWYYFKGAAAGPLQCFDLKVRSLFYSKRMDSLEVIFIMGQQLVTSELLLRVWHFSIGIAHTCYHALI